MSLYNIVKAVFKRKAKAMVVESMPTPPKPVPEQTAIAPTSDDVPKHDATWKDVEEKLMKRYSFPANAASGAVAALQAFYDGSGENASVIDEVNTARMNANGGFSLISGTIVQRMPHITKEKRTLVSP